MRIPGKITAFMLAASLLLAMAGGGADAQNRRPPRRAEKATERAAQKSDGRITVEEHRSQIMKFIVEGGDTVYIGSQLPAARVFERLGRQRGRDWRQYYRLVYNFSKVYPYAKVARHMVAEADSTIMADNLRRGKKEKYISTVQDQLFDAFEQPLRNLTVSQGALLMRLIDREVGKSPYLIIKDYKSGAAAGFWQGIAKLFGTDMKAPYDPSGADEQTEELVRIWERGEFDAVYYSLFGGYPVIPQIPERYL